MQNYNYKEAGSSGFERNYYLPAIRAFSFQHASLHRRCLSSAPFHRGGSSSLPESIAHWPSNFYPFNEAFEPLKGGWDY